MEDSAAPSASASLGAIRAINRYPVKSMAGESLKTCDIESYGVRGDRFVAFCDETKSGWARFVTARSLPELLAYRASFHEGGIAVTAPDGRKFGWDSELLQDVQRLTNTRLSMSRLQEENPEDPALLSVDAASILLVTDASLRKLEAFCGMELDQRRFRGNYVVALSGAEGGEAQWIGKRLRIGSAELQVDGCCDRCSMITLNPDTLERTPAVLKQVKERFGLNFGVYASVVRTGSVSVGDRIFCAD